MLEIEKEKVHDTIEKDRKRQIVWKEHMFTITSTPALKTETNSILRLIWRRQNTSKTQEQLKSMLMNSHERNKSFTAVFILRDLTSRWRIITSLDCLFVQSCCNQRVFASVKLSRSVTCFTAVVNVQCFCSLILDLPSTLFIQSHLEDRTI